jgi:uncharacterized protein (TIGR02596 family)
MECMNQPVRERAFTLLELLVVMGIMALLIGMVGQGLSSGSAAMQLAGAADATSAIFSQARQLAASTNQTHELRLCSWEANGEDHLGLFIYRTKVEGEAEFTGEFHLFNPPVCLASRMTTLFDGPLPVLAAGPPVKQVEATNSRQVIIHMHPSGTTNLGDGEHCLTLTTLTEERRHDGPKNFVMMLINPQNATLQVLRR